MQRAERMLNAGYSEAWPGLFVGWMPWAGRNKQQHLVAETMTAPQLPEGPRPQVAVAHLILGITCVQYLGNSYPGFSRRHRARATTMHKRPNAVAA